MDRYLSETRSFFRPGSNTGIIAKNRRFHCALLVVAARNELSIPNFLLQNILRQFVAPTGLCTFFPKIRKLHVMR
jgi:hypothetical protein